MGIITALIPGEEQSLEVYELTSSLGDRNLASFNASLRHKIMVKMRLRLLI